MCDGEEICVWIQLGKARVGGTEQFLPELPSRHAAEYVITQAECEVRSRFRRRMSVDHDCLDSSVARQFRAARNPAYVLLDVCDEWR